MRAHRMVLLSAVSLGMSSCGNSERPYASGLNGDAGGVDAAVVDTASDAAAPSATREVSASYANASYANVSSDTATQDDTAATSTAGWPASGGSEPTASNGGAGDAGPAAPCGGGDTPCLDASPGFGDDAATPDVSSGIAASSGAASSTAASSSEPPGCIPEVADADRTVFVSPSGTDSAGCGLAASPCKSVSHAVARAVAAFRELVVLDDGEFAETDTLHAPAGITIGGGWSREGATWQRVCPIERTSQSVIRSQAAVAVRVSEAGSVHLEALTIHAKETGAAGESLYGVWVNGSTSSLGLNDVTIVAGNAGSGSSGAPGGTLPGPQSCDAPGTGANGTPGGSGGTRASVFTRDGYVGGEGTAGENGQEGQTGTAGQAGSVLCVPYDGNCNHAPAADYTLVAPGGKGGCGGGAGTAGSGGGAGGSSVALYVSSGQVVVQGGSLVAGDGGDGGDGGAPGSGGIGMQGSAGGVVACPTQCNQLRDANGGSGGKGGSGGDGGKGGSGAGGNSVALAHASDATVQHSGVTFDVGQFGRGLGDGPLGFAAETYEFTP